MPETASKICVTIGRSRHRMMKAEHRALAEKGAALVELRLDYIANPPSVNRLLKDRPTPVIITVRRPEDGGRWKGNEEQRQALLRAAVVEGADYVDLEEDVAEAIPRYGDTRRVVSYHNFEETPENLAEIHARLAEKDADVVKLATMANSPADAVRMLELVQNAGMPTVGLCMGEFGTPSRILCGKYGAPWSYAAVSGKQQPAPGQLSFQQMQDVYRYASIDAETQVFGVLGDPVAHSLSPLLHNAAFEQAGIKAVYVPFRVPEGTLVETLDAFNRLDVRGYSVTIPHKQAALEWAEAHDGPVAEVGAANTLVRDEDGKWRAANTDYEAAMASLRLGLELDETMASTEDAWLQGKTVLMLGAGGVARAVGYGVIRAGGELIVTNRTPERATQLAEELGARSLPWEERSGTEADVLVNCTAVGMHPEVEASPYPAESLAERMLVFDTVYTPETPLLLKQAAERGCRTVSGMDMFVRQAAAQFERFTGHPASLEQMKETVRGVLSSK